MTALISLLAVFSYVSFFFFIIALMLNIRKYAVTPTHLRWELYPVPSEAEHEHGGSFLEHVDWWKNKVEVKIGSELKELFKEMLFIKRLFNSKRKYWYLSFLFHGGIYMILGWFLFIFIGGIMVTGSVSGLLFQAVFYITLAFGYIGVISATAGGIGLVIARYSDGNLSDLSAPVDGFNLIFALAVMISGIFALSYDPYFNIARDFMAYLISGMGYVLPVKFSIAFYPATTIQLILLCCFLIYVPFSRLTHFLGKYFTYHAVMWNSEPSMQREIFSEKYDKRIKSNLEMKVPWSGPHVPNGKKWEEVSKSEESN